MPRSGNPGFAEDVAGFVTMNLRTVWTLELLMLLRGEPERAWTPAALTAELRANLSMVDEILRRLEGLGLVGQDEEGWRYRPARPDLDDLCARTEQAYRHKPFAMISLIYRSSGPLHDLAEAFRLKGKTS
jgi:hypothetical protein